MAINIFSLEKAEQELKQNFNEFLSLSYKIYKTVDEKINSKEGITDNTIALMAEYKIKAKEKKRDVRDDCIWIISKDQPRANHLRFIIAILYSIRDLERIAEQAYNIIWYYKNSTPTEKFKKLIIESIQESLSIFKSLKKIYEEKDVTKHVETVKKYAESFKDFYKSTLANVMNNSKQNFEDIYTFTIVMKYIDRTMDHLWSIFQNFSMIKNNE